MRRKPVTRAEIRFDAGRIRTLPADAVRIDEHGRIVPIRKLWAPLERNLTEQYKREEEAWQEFFHKSFGFPKKPPHPVRLADWYFEGRFRGGLVLARCQRCGRPFYRRGGSRDCYCSDACAAAAWRASRAIHNAAAVKARGEARAAARADRHCTQCGAALTPQRSTGKFCSVRCRVAAHRARR